MIEKNNKTLMLEEKTLNDELQDDLPSYHIYEYFKDHPSVFFAIMSTAVAAITLILNFTAFLSKNSYLSYFGVDNVLYKPSTQFVSFIAITMIYTATLLLFQGFLSITFESYLPYRRELLKNKYLLMNIKAGIKERKREIKRIKKELLFFTDASFDESETTKTLKQLDQLLKKDKQLESERLSVKKAITRRSLVYIFPIIITCITIWMILCIATIILLSMSIFDWDIIIRASAILSALSVAFFTIENWFLSCVLWDDKKTLKRNAKYEIDYTPTYHELPEFPINTIFRGNVKSLLSDSNCKRIIGLVILCLLMIIIVSSWSGSQSALNQKEFYVIDIDNQKYVLIYNNGENAILEEAEIKGDSLIINTTHQVIIPSNNLNMQKYIFDSVRIKRISTRSNINSKN